MLLKRYDIIRIELNELALDELVLLAGALHRATEDYTRLGIDVPEWLSEKKKLTDNAVTFRIRDEKEHKLKKLKLQRENLKTADEKRKQVDSEIAVLEKELA